MTTEQEDIDKLESAVLSATTIPALSKALLSIDRAVTAHKKRLVNSGNMSDGDIVEIEGIIKELSTISFLGRGILQDIQKNAYIVNKINYEFRKIVRDNASKEDYAKWLKEAKEK
jgi:hypothetical protein